MIMFMTGDLREQSRGVQRSRASGCGDVRHNLDINTTSPLLLISFQVLTATGESSGIRVYSGECELAGAEANGLDIIDRDEISVVLARRIIIPLMAGTGEKRFKRLDNDVAEK